MKLFSIVVLCIACIANTYASISTDYKDLDCKKLTVMSVNDAIRDLPNLVQDFKELINKAGFNEHWDDMCQEHVSEGMEAIDELNSEKKTFKNCWNRVEMIKH